MTAGEAGSRNDAITHRIHQSQIAADNECARSGRSDVEALQIHNHIVVLGNGDLGAAGHICGEVVVTAGQRCCAVPALPADELAAVVTVGSCVADLQCAGFILGHCQIFTHGLDVTGCDDLVCLFSGSGDNAGCIDVNAGAFFHALDIQLGATHQGQAVCQILCDHRLAVNSDGSLADVDAAVNGNIAQSHSYVVVNINVTVVAVGNAVLNGAAVEVGGAAACAVDVTAVSVSLTATDGAAIHINSSTEAVDIAAVTNGQVATLRVAAFDGTAVHIQHSGCGAQDHVTAIADHSVAFLHSQSTAAQSQMTTHHCNRAVAAGKAGSFHNALTHGVQNRQMSAGVDQETTGAISCHGIAM